MNTIKEKIEQIADILISSTVEGSGVYVKDLEENIMITPQDLVETEYRIKVWRRIPYDNKGINPKAATNSR